MSEQRPRVLVARRMFPEVVDRLRPHFDVDYRDADEPIAADELAARLQGCTGALIAGTEPINATVLSACFFTWTCMTVAGMVVIAAAWAFLTYGRLS